MADDGIEMDPFGLESPHLFTFGETRPPTSQKRSEVERQYAGQSTVSSGKRQLNVRVQQEKPWGRKAPQ
jgi:hypothetical protein